MSRHTPGPWRLGQEVDGAEFVLDSTGDRVVAEVVGDWPEPARSDARIIAAAIDLYAACLAVWESKESPREVKFQALCDVATALEKAEGKTRGKP